MKPEKPQPLGPAAGHQRRGRVGEAQHEREEHHQRHRPAQRLSNQVRYSLVDRRPETHLIPHAEQAERVVIAYSPLGQGLLSGRYDADHRPRGAVRAGNPLFLPENLARAAPLVDTLRDVARHHGVTPSQVALAWAVRHRRVVAIPGASTVEQLEANAAAGELQLSAEEISALSSAAEQFNPVTGRAALPGLLRSRLRRGA